MPEGRGYRGVAGGGGRAAGGIFSEIQPNLVCVSTHMYGTCNGAIVLVPAAWGFER